MNVCAAVRREECRCMSNASLSTHASHGLALVDRQRCSTIVSQERQRRGASLQRSARQPQIARQIPKTSTGGTLSGASLPREHTTSRAIVFPCVCRKGIRGRGHGEGHSCAGFTLRAARRYLWPLLANCVVVSGVRLGWKSLAHLSMRVLPACGSRFQANAGSRCNDEGKMVGQGEPTRGWARVRPMPEEV